MPERYAALVAPGTPVTIGAQELVTPGAGEHVPKDMSQKPAVGRVQATVTRASPVVSPSTRTFTVEAVFSPAGSVLRPGMFIAATLALGSETEAVRVPRAAVFHVLGHDRVMKAVDGVAQPQDVELVGEDGAEAIVLGLEPDSQVIVRGAALVAPGAAVAAQPASAATPVAAEASAAAEASVAAPSAGGVSAGRATP